LGDCIAHGGDFRFTSASDDDEDFVRLRIHFRSLGNCTCPRNERTRSIRGVEENFFRRAVFDKREGRALQP
jgi:hypothetical protein